MLYQPEEVRWGNTEKALLTIESNEKKLQEIDKDAKDKGDILHRILRFPYADGYAVYQIIKVQKRTVRLRVCTGIGDDWVQPLIGEEGAISLEKALGYLKQRDLWAELANKKKEA